MGATRNERRVPFVATTVSHMTNLPFGFGPGGEPRRSVALLYEDPARVPQPPPFDGPILQVWEFRDPA